MIPGRFARARRKLPDDVVQVLTPADIPQLRTQNHPRLGPGDAESLVIQAPGLSHWHPASGEFLLVTPWRHRSDIPSVDVLHAFEHEDELLAAAIEAAEAQGKAAFVLLDAFEIRRPRFYQRNSLEKLESILTYEHRSPADLLVGAPPPRLEFEPWFGGDDETLAELLALDHAAFPWLWRNSREEFLAYARMPFVEIWIGRLDGRAVAYFGITHFRGWSHLDRIAVIPHGQGQGLGRETLRASVSRMLDAGADRVGLSTQRNNVRSRRMYERSGFVETPDLNYDVYGILFDEGRRQMNAIEGQEAGEDGE